MKVVVFNGSPRAERGNTHWMVQEITEGMKSAGADIEIIFLAKKRIEHCRGCFSCWIRTPGHCRIQDDMAELLPKMSSADIAVIATPVYVDNVTGIMKDFLDRSIPLADPHFGKDENGESRHFSKQIKQPKLVIVSNCGFPEQVHFQVLSHYFKRVARNMNTEVIGEIYRGGGEILKAKSFMLNFVLAGYKKLLRKAGEEIIKEGRLSENLREKLERALISDKDYIKEANKYWDKLEARRKK